MTDATSNHALLREAVARLESYLRLLKEEGIQTLEVDPGRVAQLGQKPKIARPRSPSTSLSVDAGLKEIAARIAACRKCRLCQSRTRTVPGQGSTTPEIMFIGEGPGADEDAQGLAFVGRAGQLLTKIIEAMGYTRDQVFIGNIVKCRPPENRTPLLDEMDACIPYLKEQIALLQPKIIVALGGTAMKGLFGESMPGITRTRGQWHTYEGIDVMPTYHPAYLLRNSAGKPHVWEDMKAVLKRLGKAPPTR